MDIGDIWLNEHSTLTYGQRIQKTGIHTVATFAKIGVSFLGVLVIAAGIILKPATNGTSFIISAAGIAGTYIY